MGWFKRNKNTDTEGGSIKIVEGMWVKCPFCRAIIFKREIDRNLKVCSKCQYHFPMTVEERLELIADPETFQEWDADLIPGDPLKFQDSQPYKARIEKAQHKTGKREAILTGQCQISGCAVALGIFDFSFMGGSMGSVVGEKICRAVDQALSRRIPFLLITTSGGARMQEGTLSLMQMAKTASALAKLQEAKLPFVVLLTDPTFGGVTASVAMLGDIILAEPKALIGFAGPRVIEQTIKQRLPDGFQRAEFLLEHGMVDQIVERKALKSRLRSLMIHCGMSVSA
ncbi:MAG: acetyl-CoA carboxylase carboxyltransferase subunit beta [Nitrospira sp.]|nr:acetyl-CoA carboxylase carboxyltransferase subunit beta [Nitrospira sp.]MCA9464923.1 acetyl-CoA carboxylase carboxyltransferase subunit beta [Nitrospira sp.]MCA9476081.1 acetyl-CoA carboxylase carboxyltransferase subunit beta [Nitrospira sp.]MCB9711446.1 acetyl-CoA carboxylase carboxyltransferase subunit beta [Nitrospiraceae bacterium]MDR4486238.1 acetyl-CoA carboxylase, carboxyltransferase subunit beta [Nitrospirales bacterium]